MGNMGSNSHGPQRSLSEGSSRALGRGSRLSRGLRRSLSLSWIRRESMNTTDGMPSSICSEVDQKKKYDFIADNYTTLEQVQKALRENGLESSNLIIGIDFTKSNTWTGRKSFNNRSMHAIGDTPNPYEKAISIIGETLATFDEDNLIPCFGFGDGTTYYDNVFSFHDDHTPCNGFGEVLACYKKIVPNLRLAGPTSYGPIVDAAVDIVESSGGLYHVLLIIADGQVTKSEDTSGEKLSPYEEKTIRSIINASYYPLSIVLVGVGDGPWDDMKTYDDKLHDRKFDNFQFVNFTEIMSKNIPPNKNETDFALAALMKIPTQYNAIKDLKIIGQKTGKQKTVEPKPPPKPLQARFRSQQPNNVSSTEQNMVCPICLTKGKDTAFDPCGHVTCKECSTRISNCPICRKPIRNRLKVYLD